MRASSPLRIEMENRFALRIFSELLRLRYVLLPVLADHLPDFMVLNPGAGTHLRELRSAAANCVRNRSTANIHAPITNRRGRAFSVNDVSCSLTVLLCIFVTSHKAHRASLILTANKIVTSLLVASTFSRIQPYPIWYHAHGQRTPSYIDR